MDDLGIAHQSQDIIQKILEQSIPTTIHKDYGLVPLELLEEAKRHLLEVSAKELGFIERLSFKEE